MAIARKPKLSATQAKEQSINALFGKRGSVAEGREDGGNANQTENKPVLIRIPPKALKK